MGDQPEQSTEQSTEQGDGTTVEVNAPQGDVNVGGGSSPDADAGDGK